jgi:hypothetical protein
MAPTDLILKTQEQLLRDVHALWSTMPVPDWKAPESELTGTEDEDVELAYYLAGRSYDEAMRLLGQSSESVLIWCRPDVATYYLAAYLLNGIEDLGPDACRADLQDFALNSFLRVEPLYQGVYEHILETVPVVIPIVGRYGELLELCRQAGPPPDWWEDEPYPEDPELIERIRAAWRDRDAFQQAIEAFPASDGG